MPETPILIAGPTACGKSAAALALAEKLDGVVINADAMQVYRDLPILTARPSAADEARAPHRLYGVLDAADPCSVGRWLRLAEEALAEARRQSWRPIFVGGTGLYFKALTEGLAPIPAVPKRFRDEARTLHRELGGEAFRARLARLDPLAAETLRPSDSQRLRRAYEVARATDRTLSAWQAMSDRPIAGTALGLVIEPDRARLYGAVDSRLDAMVAAGGLDEVRRLIARGLDPELPAMKALGVPQMAEAIAGTLSLAEALNRTKTATRRYAKRQMTWFRTQMMSWKQFKVKDPESIMDEIFTFVCQSTLTRE